MDTAKYDFKKILTGLRFFEGAFCLLALALFFICVRLYDIATRTPGLHYGQGLDPYSVLVLPVACLVAIPMMYYAKSKYLNTNLCEHCGRKDLKFARSLDLMLWFFSWFCLMNNHFDPNIYQPYSVLSVPLRLLITSALFQFAFPGFLLLFILSLIHSLLILFELADSYPVTAIREEMKATKRSFFVNLAILSVWYAIFTIAIAKLNIFLTILAMVGLLASINGLYKAFSKYKHLLKYAEAQQAGPENIEELEETIISTVRP